MYRAKNIKAFKPSRATLRRWMRMTDYNDHAGVCAEKVKFITKALRKVGEAVMAGESSRLYDKIKELVEIRDATGGLTAEEASNAYTYYKMALAIAVEVAGSTAEVEIEGMK